MATSFLIEQSTKSGRLLPALFAEVLAKLPEVRGTMKGQELRLALELELDDEACAGWILDFAGQGARVEGSVTGPSAAALALALEFIAKQLDCKLAIDGDEISSADGVAYLETYEADVFDLRDNPDDLDGDAFVAWLVREEGIALQRDQDFSTLPLDDPPAVYETLLDAESVDDIFVSERELARMLAKFRARLGKN